MGQPYNLKSNEMNKLPFERTVSLDEALSLATDYLARNNIGFEFEVYGDTPESYICTLYEDGDKICSGGGKGANARQSMVSAIFEAIEHSALHYNFVKGKIKLLDSITTFKSSWHKDIPYSLLSENHGKVMCLPYKSLDNNEEIHLPIALVNPSYIEAEEGYPKHRAFTKEQRGEDTFDYSSLIKYSTTNGISAGVSSDECIIHSISEIIERYTLGEFILNFVALNKHENYKRINTESLPDDLKSLYLSCCNELYGSKIHIIDITSHRWGVPVYLIYLDHPEPAFRTFSGGASLDNKHALERALTEMLQRRTHPHSKLNNAQGNLKSIMETWYEKEYGDMNRDNVLKFFNITKINGDLLNIKEFDFIDNSKDIRQQNLFEHRKSLLEKVTAAGGEAFYTPLLDESNLKVYSCFIHPYEPAFILSSGRMVCLTQQNLMTLTETAL